MTGTATTVAGSATGHGLGNRKELGDHDGLGDCKGPGNGHGIDDLNGLDDRNRRGRSRNTKTPKTPGFPGHCLELLEERRVPFVCLLELQSERRVLCLEHVDVGGLGLEDFQLKTDVIKKRPSSS